MQKDLTSLEAKRIRVVALSYDSVDVLTKFSGEKKIMFPLVSDPDSKTIKAFGLLNTEAAERISGVPYPGTMILDKKGTIRAKLFYDGHRHRHAAADIVKAVGEIE